MEEFQELVGEVVDSLPEEFQIAIKDVPIFVDDYVTDDIAKALGCQKEMVCGLYHKTGSVSFLSIVPQVSCIDIYYRPIIRMALSFDDLKELIQNTLLHEIGHYFGLDHDIMGASVR